MPQVGTDVAQEVEAGRVGPVEVLEEDEDWTSGGELGQESPHLGEERGLIGDRRQPAAGEGGRGRGQARVALASLEQVEPRTVGRGVGQVVAGPGQDAAAESGRVVESGRGPGWSCRCPLRHRRGRAGRPRRGRGQLLAQNILLPRPADEERGRPQGGDARSAGVAVRPRGDVVHNCPISVASCLEIVPIRRGVCIDGPQREGNATWDVDMVARSARRMAGASARLMTRGVGGEGRHR